MQKCKISNVLSPIQPSQEATVGDATPTERVNIQEEDTALRTGIQYRGETKPSQGDSKERFWGKGCVGEPEGTGAVALGDHSS